MTNGDKIRSMTDEELQRLRKLVKQQATELERRDMAHIGGRR